MNDNVENNKSDRNNETKEKSFSIRSRGLAYVKSVSKKTENGVETVKIKLNILSGRQDKIIYVPASLFVNGEKAKTIVSEIPVINDGDKVLISFTADMRPDAFITEESKIISYFIGSLYFVKSVKVNGKFTYLAPVEESTNIEKSFDSFDDDIPF